MAIEQVFHESFLLRFFKPISTYATLIRIRKIADAVLSNFAYIMDGAKSDLSFAHLSIGVGTFSLLMHNK